MNHDGNPLLSIGLARFTCDYCRQKKFRCSRELPKCSACKPWPGSCDYTRDKSASTSGSIQAHIRSKTPSTESPSNVDQRLRNIERTLQKLTETVEKVLAVVASNPELENASSAHRETQATKDHVQEDDNIPGLFVGPSHSFSFLREASNNIKGASHTSTSLSHEKAQSELQFLSASLTTASVNTGSVEEAPRFYVPPKAIGYQLIGGFLEHAPTGELFFNTPSDDLLKQIVFEPEKVTQKAWVVYFNYIMLAQVSTERADQNRQAEKFRHNVRIALNDSSIFLEPREVNVQALTLLAFHGEDYASPNLSWMLVGHACRQAEALGLHTPNHSDFESRQRSLSIFWLLFIVDKSCSLAFGRSPFLPVCLYEHVPLPEFNYLLKFQPYTDTASGDSKKASKPSHFGAHFLLKGVELAKLMGLVIDLLGPGPSTLSRQAIRIRLEKWYQDTSQLLTHIMETESQSLETAQIQEMSLGLNSLRFQYLHIIIVLLKEDSDFTHMKLESAREALFLLPSIVSNWSSVYNGVIWHLLYYPFIPFFVVFENLVQHHTLQSSTTIDQDLQLLSTTVSYFASMRDQMRLLATVCTRLEHVAAVFLQLAKSHIDQRRSPPYETQGSNPPVFKKFSSGAPITLVQPVGSYTAASTLAGKEDAGACGQLGGNLVLGNHLEIENFLNWLPVDTFTSGPFIARERPGSSAPAKEVSADAGSSSLEVSRGSKRAFDAAFDWFSWDAYYTDAKTRQGLP